jgi:hypothetical protein
MPSFFKHKNDILSKIQLKSWWRQLKKPSKKKTSLSNSSSNTTLDWRSLSPDRPPLPFFTTKSNHNNIDTTIIESSSTLDIPIEKIKKVKFSRFRGTINKNSICFCFSLQK